MQPFRVFAKPLSLLILSGFLPMSLNIPLAHAELIGTDIALSQQTSQLARQHIDATLQREDLRLALQDRGVNLNDIEARVAALTDAEAIQMAAQIDQAPAGGEGVVGAILLVFLLLLLTDILCLTHVYPFVTKRNCR